MAYYQKKKEPVKVNKEARILSSICKDCGRYGKISKQFCFDCYKETIKTLRNPN